MSVRHPIPDAALDDRLGFVGMTGSGKTFGAGTCVERILARRGRVIIPDPLGVWWGARLLADGKKASPYDIVIFGGRYADLPITPQSGALIGETVAGMRESAIIDLSQFETAASERQFMLAFLDALYRKSTGDPVHLIFDEADLWAPERIVDKEGEATKLHGVMQTVVRRGRIKGLTSWLISQRPAALSKSVLSQVDGLVAFRLTASQDRKALGLWIEGQADKEAGRAILGRLPEKRQGEAGVWLPGYGVLSDVQFPMKHTFDSSRAPKRGEKKQSTALQPLNLDALRSKLATVEAEVKASDPKALKAEIATLRRQMQEAAAAATKAGTVPDPQTIEAAEKRGHASGFTEGSHAMLEASMSALDAIMHDVGNVVADNLRRFHAMLDKPAAPSRPVARQAHQPNQRPAVVRQPAADGDLTRPQQKIIDSLTLWKSLGHEQPSREMIAAVAGYSPSSGGFNNLIGSTRSERSAVGSGVLICKLDAGIGVKQHATHEHDDIDVGSLSAVEQRPASPCQK